MVTLETERLILRPPEGADADVLAAMHQEPEALKYVLGGVPPAGGAEMAWRNIAMLIGHWHLRGFGPWIVVEKSSHAIIGRVGLWQPAGWPGCELNWLIRQAWGRRGLATEAARQALHWAWQQPRLERVISLIQPDNTPSIRVAEKIGETRTGEHVITGTLLHEYSVVRRDRD